jgi:RNA polymerase sigma-70 factor (ECF subfamily)
LTSSAGSHSPPDGEIVREVLKGNPKLFHELVDRHLPSLLGFFRFLRVPEDSIDDMIQETFLRAFEHLDSFDRSRSFITWLTVIGRNAFYSELRKKNRQAPELPENAPEHSSHGDFDEVLARESVRELLDGLDEESRFLIELRVFRELPFNDMAELTGIPLATLRVRIHRILHRLRLRAKEVKVYEQ